jgi:hypothetical protein
LLELPQIREGRLGDLAAGEQEMRSSGEVRHRSIGGVVAALLAAALPATARALPSCPPASPAQISDPRFLVNGVWQRYRNLTPEHRCCAKQCEPLARFAAKIEANALKLDAVARDTRLSSEAKRQARLDANEMFGLRADLAAEFTGCLNDTIPRSSASGMVCGKPRLAAVDLAWVK